MVPNLSFRKKKVLNLYIFLLSVPPIIEDFITKNDICLMNDKSNTFLDSGKGTVSAIDLSLCHASLYLDFDWSVCEDQHGSDHFPIVIENI